MKCEAAFKSCKCGLDDGHEGAHICVTPDPVCGGVWIESEGKFQAILWPGIRDHDDPLMAVMVEVLGIVDGDLATLTPGTIGGLSS